MGGDVTAAEEPAGGDAQEDLPDVDLEVGALLPRGRRGHLNLAHISRTVLRKAWFQNDPKSGEINLYLAIILYNFKVLLRF